mgnify:CR=1 FL=1
MNSSDNFQDSALSRLMPLMNSSFTPGQAQATVDNFQDWINGRLHKLNYIISRDVQKNAEILRNFISRTRISVCACPQHFYILFPILLLEIHLPPEWDSEISRNVFLLQKTVLHQKESWLPVFLPTIWPWY